MNKAYLLTLALLLPIQTMAVEQDSVYTWGQWSKGIQPAAGPVAKVTPPPAQTPDVNFRANETSAFLREAVSVQPNIVTGIHDVNPSTPVQVLPPTPVTPPPPPPPAS